MVFSPLISFRIFWDSNYITLDGFYRSVISATTTIKSHTLAVIGIIERNIIARFIKVPAFVNTWSIPKTVPLLITIFEYQPFGMYQHIWLVSTCGMSLETAILNKSSRCIESVHAGWIEDAIPYFKILATKNYPCFAPSAVKLRFDLIPIRLHLIYHTAELPCLTHNQILEQYRSLFFHGPRRHDDSPCTWRPHY